MEFIENAPPKEIFDGGQFPFQVFVLYENVGEADIKKGKLRLTLTGIYHGDFGVDRAEDFKAFNPVQIRGVIKDPEGNKIRGGVHQQKFPAKKAVFNFTPVITGTHEYPIRIDACYEYETIAVSSICLRENVGQPDAGVCRITGPRDYSNSGAPVSVSSMEEALGGVNSILINFRVKKSGPSEIFMLEEGGPNCSSGYDKRNRVHVTVNTGTPGVNNDPLNSNLNCIGLAFDDGSTRSGELILNRGEGVVSCIQNLPKNVQVNAVKGIQIDLRYQIKDSITTKLVVKNQFGRNLDNGISGQTNDGKPDLVVKSLKNVPETATAGRSYSIIADIRNEGFADAGSFIAKLYLHSRIKNFESQEIESYSIDPIKKGDSNSKPRLDFTLPSNLRQGRYWFEVRVDTSNVPGEVDETNNYATSTGLSICPQTGCKIPS